MKLTALFIAGSAILVVACGPTPHPEPPGPKPLPPSPTFITGNLEPMIVDWQPEQRGDLEEVMRDGLVVVAYDDKGFRLLKDCKVDGKYDFMGMTRRERVVRLESADDVKANLPLGGVGLAAQLGGEFAKGATLDIAMVTIGKIRTTWRHVAKKDLIGGNCATASHVVRGATVGAFAVDKGDKMRARAVAEIFGAGINGGTQSKSMVRVVDGVLSDCEQAAPDSPKAPRQCGAIIRVELIPINAKEEDAHDKKVTANDRDPELRDTCPPGMSMVDGKCTKPTSATPTSPKTAAECTYGNARQCLEACKVGQAKSCSKLALMAWKGEGGSPQAQSEAAGVAGKACRDGDPAGCTLLGNFLMVGGQGVTKDPRKAAEAFAKGCDDGDADGCMMVGTMLLTGNGVPRETKLASKALTKGCKGGAHGACSDLGLLFMGGQGFDKDLPLAAGLFKKACDGDNSTGCSNYAYMQEFGMGTAKDVQKAVLGYAKSCKLDDSSCTWLAAMFQLGKGGLTKDDNKAVQLYKLSCSKGDPVACAIVRAYLDPSQKVDSDQIKGYVNVWKGTCDAGTARDCSGLGVIAVNLGMKDESKTLLARGCQLGDEWGCLMARMQPRIP